MSNIKPSDHGIVVEHKESGIRYAVSDRNYNDKIHRKVRDLRPGESVRSYRPRPSESLGDALGGQGGTGTHDADESQASGSSEPLGTTEGASHGTQEKKG